jgi:hypothetical protein
VNPHLTDVSLVAYLDGGRESASRETAQHLADCADCRRRLGEYQAVLRAAKAPAWSDVQAEALRHRIRRAVRSPRRASGSSWVPALAGGATALLAVVALTQRLPPGEVATGPGAAATVDRGDEFGVGDRASAEEMAQTIEVYLIDTASEDELLMQLPQIDPGELGAWAED